MKRIRCSIEVLVVTLVVVALGTAPTRAAEAKLRNGPSGRDLFLEECARCHGSGAKGDGPDAPFFSPLPRDLTTGFLEEYDDEEVIARLRDGTPLTLSVDPEGRRIRAGRVESITAHMKRLPGIEWVDVDAGAVLYGNRCEVCHGQFGHPWPAPDLPPGVQVMPTDLRSPAVQKMTDAKLIGTFRHGAEAMPAVPSKLTDDEAEQLLAFVRVLSPGFETYSFYCAGCHGDRGRGGGILARRGDGPKVVFDEAYFAAKDPEDLRADVWHMMDVGGGGMPHFKGVVGDDRLRAIVEYLERAN